MLFTKKSELRNLIYTLLFLLIFNFPCKASDLSEKGRLPYQVYFYIPVSFWPNSNAIERLLSKSPFQDAGVQLLQSSTGYHVSMGSYLMSSKSSANDVAFKIQKLVRSTFSKFTAEIVNKHGGVDIFGKFVVLVLKTDKKKSNKRHNVFQVIHRKIKKMIVTAGGSEIGFLKFKPHCSIASVLDVSAPSFQKIRKRLIKDLISQASRVHLAVNPRVLQYRVSPSSNVDEKSLHEEGGFLLQDQCMR